MPKDKKQLTQEDLLRSIGEYAQRENKKQEEKEEKEAKDKKFIEKSLEELKKITITEDNSEDEIINELEKLHTARINADRVIPKNTDENNNNDKRKEYEDTMKEKYEKIVINIQKRQKKFKEQIEKSTADDYRDFITLIENMPNFNKIYKDFIEIENIASALKEHQNFLKKAFDIIDRKYLDAHSNNRPDEAKKFETLIYKLGAVYLDGIEQQASLMKIKQMKEDEKSIGQKIKDRLPFFSNKEERIVAMDVSKNATFDHLLNQPYPFFESQFHKKMNKVFTGKGIKIDKGETGEQNGVTYDRKTGKIIIGKGKSGIAKITRENKNKNLIDSYDYLTFENGKIIPEKCIFGQKGRSGFDNIIEGDGTNFTVEQNQIKDKPTKKFEAIDRGEFEKKVVKEVRKRAKSESPAEYNEELSSYFHHNNTTRWFMRNIGFPRDVKFDKNGHLDWNRTEKNISPDYKNHVEQAVIDTLKQYPNRNYEQYITKEVNNKESLKNILQADYRKNTPQLIMQHVSNKQSKQEKELEKQDNPLEKKLTSQVTSAAPAAKQSVSPHPPKTLNTGRGR